MFINKAHREGDAVKTDGYRSRGRDHRGGDFHRNGERTMILTLRLPRRRPCDGVSTTETNVSSARASKETARCSYDSFTPSI